MRLLVIDDSKAMRMLVLRALRQEGFDFAYREAADGEDALQVLTEFTPDVILADWNMPKMNGITLLRELRTAGNKIPFGFVTSATTRGIRESAMEEGAAFFVSKPFDPMELADAVRGALQ